MSIHALGTRAYRVGAQGRKAGRAGKIEGYLGAGDKSMKIRSSREHLTCNGVSSSLTRKACITIAERVSTFAFRR